MKCSTHRAGKPPVTPGVPEPFGASFAGVPRLTFDRSAVASGGSGKCTAASLHVAQVGSGGRNRCRATGWDARGCVIQGFPGALRAVTVPLTLSHPLSPSLTLPAPSRTLQRLSPVTPEYGTLARATRRHSPTMLGPHRRPADHLRRHGGRNHRRDPVSAHESSVMMWVAGGGARHRRTGAGDDAPPFGCRRGATHRAPHHTG